MLEGRRAKARRGELGKPVPMGYVRRPSGEVALDPDEQAPGGGPGTGRRSPRAGTALLSGLMVCGRCGLRMVAAYNNDGHAARYICSSQNVSYGGPFCQSLKAAPVDGQVTSIVLQALQPAALEASLAVAADLQAERAALEQQWRQRLERAQYKVDPARRRYASTEPENRLVARTLERDWRRPWPSRYG